MLRVTEMIRGTVRDAGCSNGNYIPVTLHIHDDEDNRDLMWMGKTCRCGNGCSETWRTGTTDDKGDWIPITEETFRDEAELEAYLASEEEVDWDDVD